MIGLNGFSLQTTKTLLSWVSSMYRDEVQGPKPCAWTTKTLRLSSSICNYDGVGFTELVDDTSPGYTFAEQSGTEMFGYTTLGPQPNLEPEIYNQQPIFFPAAHDYWSVLQVCMFGEGGVELSGDPNQLIFGFTIGDGDGGPYIIEPGHSFGFLQYDLKILLQTPYHVQP